MNNNYYLICNLFNNLIKFDLIIENLMKNSSTLDVYIFFLRK